MNEKFQKLIKESGNNLHMRVTEFLEKEGWDVDLSSYYHDDTTEKPREIDIIATKVKDIREDFTRGVKDWFKIFLFIECKHFKEDIAFRMHKNNKQKSQSAIFIEGANLTKDEILTHHSNLIETHHYLRVPTLAKLYDSVEDQKVFEAITRPVKSLIFFKEHGKEKGIYYPLVIYSGINSLYIIENNSDLSKLENLKALENLIFGLNYSYRSAVSNKLETQYFCVDFIHEKKLSEFLEMIEKQEVGVLAGISRFLIGTKGETLF